MLTIIFFCKDYSRRCEVNWWNNTIIDSYSYYLLDQTIGSIADV